MSFRDLEVWRRSLNLSVSIYRNLSSLTDFGFKGQITRSSLSIPSNIAEGYGRESNKDLIRFLYIAKGSCSELETQIIIGMKVEFIHPKLADRWLKEAEELSAMLGGLIQTRKTYN